MSSSVSIIIPVYNEELAIDQTIEQLLSNEFFKNFEIIVVNDGSVDQTSNILKKFSGIKVINHPVNRGYGSSLTTGMLNAKGDIVVWMDSDGQHRIEDLIKIINAMIENDLDYCIGVRGEDSFQEPTRKFGKWILHQVVKIVAGNSVIDFNSGLRGFKRSIINKYLHLMPREFGASTTTTLLMVERSYKGQQIPIRVLPRIGKSSVRQVKDGVKTLNLILRIFLIFKPLHFFGGIGLLMFLFGLLYGLIKAYVVGKGFPVLAAVVTLTGLQTIFMGLIMDHISAIRRERFE